MNKILIALPLFPSLWALKEAQRVYQSCLKDPVYPEDKWFAVGRYWDINVFTDDQGEKKATLYRVKKGSTNTSQGFLVTLEKDESKVNV